MINVQVALTLSRTEMQQQAERSLGQHSTTFVTDPLGGNLSAM